MKTNGKIGALAQRDGRDIRDTRCDPRPGQPTRAFQRSLATVVVLTALCRDAATVQGQITDVNVGSGPEAMDGDTIRNAFIKCNNDFNWIGGQLNTINSSIAGFATEYDPYGLALSVGLYATNYTRYVVGTNTVGWLGCLNAQSNVLQGDITALTNNVNSLWSALGGASVLHSGGQMAFDQATAWPHAMQITSDGNGNLTVSGNAAVFGSIHASYLLDSYSGTPAVGYVATSQGTDGIWQWQALPTFPTTLNFDAGSIASDGSGNASFVGLYAQRLEDSGGGTGSPGYFAQANGRGGWLWTAWPTTLSYDAGDIMSDGAGNIKATGFKGSLLDNGCASGAVGDIPTANGDGSWTWGGSGFPDLTDSGGKIGVNQTSPAYNLDIQGTAGDSQDGTWSVDNSGNFNALSFNQMSDATLKTNIAPYAPTNLLDRLAALPVYSWRFKDRTTVQGANRATVHGIHTLTRTNLLVGQRHIGPMAQDWNASFGLGGGTNVINSTDLQGILLEAVRQLASPGSAVLTNAAGARFTVLVNAVTNGLVFVPQ